VDFSNTKVNFNKHFVIVAIDEIRAVGWRIEITSVIEWSDRIAVVVTVRTPHIELPADTQPFTVVKIPKTKKKIEFQHIIL